MWATRAGASLRLLQPLHSTAVGAATRPSVSALLSLCDDQLGPDQTRRFFSARRRFRRINRQTGSVTMPSTGDKPKTPPTLDMVQSLKYDYMDMDNVSLVTLAAMDNPKAREELLKRHIMLVDQVDYLKACDTFRVIAATNRKGMFLASIPYQVGVGLAMFSAFASIPLVFDVGTAEWFNEVFVTTDVPEPEDLETMLEVGSWTWNWMEPPLGQISFFLLCLQFSRSQLANLGISPYTSQLKMWRAQNLSKSFPQYDRKIVEAYSETDPIFPSRVGW